MNEMVLIDDDLLDRTSEKALRAPRLRMNHNFHTREDEPVNRLLNAMEPGTYLPVHRHTAPPKSESIVVAQRAPSRVRFRRPGTNLLHRAVVGSVARRVWVRHRSGRMARVARARAGNGRFRGQAGPVCAGRSGRSGAVDAGGGRCRGGRALPRVASRASAAVGMNHVNRII